MNNYQQKNTYFTPATAANSMSTLKVPTSFNIDVEFEVPEFFRRFLALFIDMVIQYLYLVLAGKIFNWIIHSMDTTNQNSFYELEAYRQLLWVPVLIYHGLLEITMNGQSFGKRLLKLRVVNENGGRASISQFLIRWLLRTSDTWIVIVLIILVYSQQMEFSTEVTFMVVAVIAFLLTDIILVISSPKGQRIGDILAKTILIRTNTKSSITETVFQEVEDGYTPVFPQIMQLSDKDINAIKSILESARRRSDPAIAETAAEKIKTHLGIHTQMEPITFLEVLLKDYNYLSVK